MTESVVGPTTDLDRAFRLGSGGPRGATAGGDPGAPRRRMRLVPARLGS
jgi:hypothetical protein